MQKTMLIFLGFLTLFFTAGCGDKFKTYQVTGKVTYKGEPVAGAIVSFSPKVQGQGDGAFGRTDSYGVYKLQTRQGKPEGGTTPGEYIVMVSKTETVPTGRTSVGPGGAMIQEQKPVQVLPAEYGDPAKSPLSFTVEKKRNTFDIPIEGK
ncbi:MAG: hypothetical protein FWC50_04735 [Planctomycetaceae bacterium]|nr:hypothetical protein [Planctomycetaceae bacterium]